MACIFGVLCIAEEFPLKVVFILTSLDRIFLKYFAYFHVAFPGNVIKRLYLGFQYKFLYVIVGA